jgi:hypothetical protein
MYVRYAEEEAVHRAQVLVGTLGAALGGKKMPKAPTLIVSSADESPDRAAFYRNPEIRKRIVRGTG